MSIISNKSLDDTLCCISGILEIIETNSYIKRNYDGLLALSNPKYDLFIDAHDVSLKGKKEDSWEWQNLMNFIQRYFDSNNSILDIAIKHNVLYKYLYKYLKKFEEKDLIKFVSMNNHKII